MGKFQSLMNRKWFGWRNNRSTRLYEFIIDRAESEDKKTRFYREEAASSPKLRLYTSLMNGRLSVSDPSLQLLVNRISSEWLNERGEKWSDPLLPNEVLEMTSPVKALNSGKTSNSVREFLRINKRYALLRWQHKQRHQFGKMLMVFGDRLLSSESWHNRLFKNIIGHTKYMGTHQSQHAICIFLSGPGFPE